MWSRERVMTTTTAAPDARARKKSVKSTSAGMDGQVGGISARNESSWPKSRVRR
jgi:hypothetical protein